MTSPNLTRAAARAQSATLETSRFIVRTLEIRPRYAKFSPSGTVLWTKDKAEAEIMLASQARSIHRDASDSGMSVTRERVT